MFKHTIVLILPTITVALKIYYVLPDNGLVYNSATDKTAFTLTHYLKHSSEYITSNTQMAFLPGKFNLPSHFTISVIFVHFSLIGNHQKFPEINCSTSFAILFYNCTNITTRGFKLMSCAIDTSGMVRETSSLSLFFAQMLHFYI